MRTRITRVLALTAAGLILVPASATAQLRIKNRYATILGGYDSNVNRISSEFPPPNSGIKDDGRIVIFGGIGIEYKSGRLFQLKLDGKPYFIKYTDLTEFDRAEIFLSASAKTKIGDRFHLEIGDRYRYTDFPNQAAVERLYNSSRTRLNFRGSSLWSVSAQYRFLYRDNLRRNLDTSRAHGIAGSVRLDPLDRLSVGVTVQHDFERVSFVFPRDVSGDRTWLDISLRYLHRKRTLVLGKYLYQRDEMDIVFAEGSDFEKLGDSADDFSDGILQSIRFLEDVDFNFRKHLGILSTHTNIRPGTFLEVFLLYQRKHLAQHVVEIASRPQRIDETFVAQGAFQLSLGNGFSVLMNVRFEDSDSNDPDHDFRFTTVGIGLKRKF